MSSSRRRSLRGRSPGLARAQGHRGGSQLRATLSDGRLRFRVNAAVILAHIDRSATDVIPVLVEGLNPQGDEAVDAEGDVARALARFGPQAKSALPVLVGLDDQGVG